MGWTAPGELAAQRARQPVAGRHHQRSPHACGAEARQEPECHPCFVGIPEHRGTGDEAPDVAPGGRVGDDPHARVGGHAQRLRPGCTRRHGWRATATGIGGGTGDPDLLRLLPKLAASVT